MQLTYPQSLPISDHRLQICEAVRNNQVVIVAGDTGSGKTTQLPKMLIEAGCGSKGMIGCTQPRRIAATSVAERVMEETGTRDKVGYKIRFQEKVSERTIVKFMTDGILLAEIKSDPLLRQYSALIIDEAHERSLNIDFLLGYIKQLLVKRPELKLVISSATIDTEKFSESFADAPVIKVSGRLFPITTIYHDPEDREESEKDQYVEHAIEVIEELTLDPFGGDILVFMPSERDILDTINGIHDNIRSQTLILPLFGRLQASDQRKIFQSATKRKIIVATNVAETSITVPGIRFVIDTGLARISRYNPRTGTTSLRISKISQASCNQRQGRCGRTGPGTCIRLYSEEDYHNRDMYTLPEIQRSNLAEVILQMVHLNLGKPESFPFIDPPLPRAIREGYRTLRELGALTREDTLTREGKVMATLPLDPKISRIIIEGNRRNALQETIIIAAALSIQDPRIRPLDKEHQADQQHRTFLNKQSDFLTLLNIWHGLFNDEKKVSWSKLGKFCKEYYLSWQRMREWIDVREQITRLLAKRKNFSFNPEPADYASIHCSLICGFLRNIGYKKEKNKYLAAGNKEVILFPGSALYNRAADWVLAAYFVETTQLFARTVANIEPEWLEKPAGDLCKYSWSNPRWEKKSGRVVADEKVSLFGLPIVAGRKVNYGRLNPAAGEEAKAIFIREALIKGALGGRYHFIKKNQHLLKELQELEERLRRRSILVQEDQLFAFYDARIGKCYDRFTLNRLMRRKKGDFFLHMTREDICLNSPDEDELYRYPKTMQAGEFELSLDYRFEPGHDADGVTAMLPYTAVFQINPSIFEWLVPGLLPEKLLFLFKRLPKRLRKNLVPLPDSVDRVLDGIQLYQGSLYQNIEKALLHSHNLTITRQDWQADTLPPHLKMRFCLLDEKGKPSFYSRSFHRVMEKAREKTAPPVQADRKRLPETKNMVAEDLDLVESRITLAGSGKRVVDIYFPLLRCDQRTGQVNLEYSNDGQAVMEHTPEGLAKLYGREFPGEVKKLKKQCKQAVAENSAGWLALGGGLSAARLRDAIFLFVMHALFQVKNRDLPTFAHFDGRVEEVRKAGFFRLANPVLSTVTDLLKQRKDVKQVINQWAARAQKSKAYDQARCNEYLQAMELILPQDFLFTRDPEGLQNANRYLRALVIRIERAEHSPEKDRKKAQRLGTALCRLEQIDQFKSPTDLCIELQHTYRRLVEEFRVSIFAPELGTAVSVSEKKLEAAWQEVENGCRTVE